jgi:hypothetical protein
MKRFLAGTTVALFGLAPMIGWACEYTDASMAASTPEAKLGLAAAPAASKAPAPVVAKAPAVKQAKVASDKATSQSASGAKLAEATHR